MLNFCFAKILLFFNVIKFFFLRIEKKCIFAVLVMCVAELLLCM